MMPQITISISPRKLIVGAASLILGWLSFISVQSINDHAAIAALQAHRASDERQDAELREIRRTIQDMSLLFFEGADDEMRDRPADFSAAQMVIEEMVNRKGSR